MSDKWISVEDRLPDKQGEYLMHSVPGDPDKRYIFIAGWMEGGWCSVMPNYINSATHWMPLPEPPVTANEFDKPVRCAACGELGLEKICPECGPLDLIEGKWPHCINCFKTTNPAYSKHHRVLTCWSCGGRMARQADGITKPKGERR